MYYKNLARYYRISVGELTRMNEKPINKKSKVEMDDEIILTHVHFLYLITGTFRQHCPSMNFRMLKLRIFLLTKVMAWVKIYK